MFGFRGAAVTLLFCACPPPQETADSGTKDAGYEARPAPAADLERDIVSLALTVDLVNLLGRATLVLAPSEGPGASFEAKGLTVDSVRLPDGGDLRFTANADGRGRLDVGVPVSATPSQLVIRYGFTGGRTQFDGLLEGGSTLTWPYFCGNVFPCHSNPADGVSFTLDVSGNPAGTTLVYARHVAEAPAYQLAWAMGAYAYADLGRTDAGTRVGIWHLPDSAAAAADGGAHLRQVFEWYEGHYGAYPFGDDVAAVDVVWRQGAYGGMEHHPYWHVAHDALADEVVHAHEAAHGWFGDGVRLSCWEDFVMSEGLASYLALRALTDVAGPDAGAGVLATYRARLDLVATVAAWPEGCGSVDPLAQFSEAPYMKGAWFFRALEARIGAAAVDRGLRRFFTEHRGQAASMQQLLDTLRAEGGYDPGTCAQAWLRATALPAVQDSCP